MKHVFNRGRDTPDLGATALNLGVCPQCGKRRYASRKLASRAAKLIYHGESLTAYKCGAY